MDTQRIHFLREVLVGTGEEKTTGVIQFSYDDRFVRKPSFFEAPDDEMVRARQLYKAWGGTRPEGCQRGTTVSRPEM